MKKYMVAAAIVASIIIFAVLVSIYTPTRAASSVTPIGWKVFSSPPTSQWAIIRLITAPAVIFASNTGIIPQYPDAASLNATRIGTFCTSIAPNGACLGFQPLQQTGWRYDQTNGLVFIHFLGAKAVNISLFAGQAGSTFTTTMVSTVTSSSTIVVISLTTITSTVTASPVTVTATNTNVVLVTFITTTVLTTATTVSTSTVLTTTTPTATVTVQTTTTTTAS